MPTYIMLSKLTPEGTQTIKNNPQRIREVNREIEQLGATVKAQWATLGRFDFVNVVEAPDEKTIARVSLELGSRGTVQYETLTAIPIDDFIASLVAARADRSSSSARAGASTRSCARSRARRRRRSCCARPATPASPRDARLLDVAVDDVAGLVARGARARTSTLTVVGPEAPLVAGARRRVRGRRPALLRAARGGRAAGGLEGVLEGGDGGGRRADGRLRGGRRRSSRGWPRSRATRSSSRPTGSPPARAS